MKEQQPKYVNTSDSQSRLDIDIRDLKDRLSSINRIARELENEKLKNIIG